MSEEIINVQTLVDRAFPISTIPLGDEKATGRHYRDASFNFLNYPNWESGKAFKPHDQAKLKCQPPFWPADLFAITAQLLERSGAYQRLANQIRTKPDSNKPDPKTPEDWEKFIDFTSENLGTGFGVSGSHRLLLRLIGALWGHGALFVSGIFKDDKVVSKEIVAKSNAEAALKAIGFLDSRQNQEVRHADLVKVSQSILDKMVDELNFTTSRIDLETDRFVKFAPVTSEASKLALDALCRLHNQYLDKSGETATHTHAQVIGEYSGQGSEIAGAHSLIIWANAYIQHHWDILRRSNRPIGLSVVAQEPAVEDYAWWRAALRLLIIADEAGKGMGLSDKDGEREKQTEKDEGKEFWKFPPQAGRDCRSLWGYYELAHDAHLAARYQSTHKRLFPRTLTRCFEEELGSVLPKTRTPGTGCTIRSLSHNFAMLPPKGRVRARWARQSRPNERVAYNILVVPYPYQIKSTHIAPEQVRPDDDWGFFRVNHEWLYEIVDETSKVVRIAKTGTEKKECRAKFWAFLASLIRDQPLDTVNAVVLPEAALDWETFDLVQRKLPGAFPSIEMLVCGLTTYKERGIRKPIEGNFVATYLRSETTEKAGVPCWLIEHARAKHHRWRLDSQQLRTYALSNRLPPDKLWWEGIDLPPREMLFAEFSPGSVVTTLICEDLARIEPCQVALRAIGPNLVLVLLMDSAQVIGRWPHQYASVFSDDPGSSVLTLTSFGLIKRSNLSENRTSREIALWREPHGGGGQAITLPVGYDAQLISIRREFCLERTLDGRGDNGDSAIAWRFAGLIPIKSPLSPPGGKADD